MLGNNSKKTAVSNSENPRRKVKHHEFTQDERGKCPIEPPTKKAEKIEVMSRRKLVGRRQRRCLWTKPTAQI